MHFELNPIPYQNLPLDSPITLDVKRIDLAHPTISGNKFYKLKYNLSTASAQGYTQLLSFGGAYSNHIYALAHAADYYGFESIGIIRGEELADQPLNKSLQKVTELGMQLKFISRQTYRQKHLPLYLEQLKREYPNAYIIPEGGTNDLAIQGCMEILTQKNLNQYDVICCAVGTGGTISGLINRTTDQHLVLGFSALKGDFLNREITQMTNKRNWVIFSDEIFGGYGKFNSELLSFMIDIERKHHLPLERIYTAKAVYRILKLINENYFPAHTRILFIHTGGLQTSSI